MNDFFAKVSGLDIANRYYMQRPSSGWVLAGVPNLEIRIYRLNNIPIGAGTDLPAYIKKSKSIIGLTHHETNNYRYEDNLCLFRYLALCFGADGNGFERLVLAYKEKLEEATGKNYDQGVGLDELEEVEDEFQISINIYSLQEDKSAEVVRISEKSYEKVMHLNLYDSHFSYITKFKSYAKKYQCPSCSQFIGRGTNFARHIR